MAPPVNVNNNPNINLYQNPFAGSSVLSGLGENLVNQINDKTPQQLPGYLSVSDDRMVSFGPDTTNSQVVQTLKLLGLIEDDDYAWFQDWFKESGAGNGTWMARSFNDPDNDLDDRGLDGFNQEDKSRFERAFQVLNPASRAGGFVAPPQWTPRPVFIGQPPTGGSPEQPFYSQSDILVSSAEQPNLYDVYDPYAPFVREDPYSSEVVLQYPYQPPEGPTPPLVFETTPATPLDPFPTPYTPSPTVPEPYTPDPIVPSPGPESPVLTGSYDPGVSLVTGKRWDEMNQVEKLAHVIARGETDYSRQFANTPEYQQAQQYLQNKYGSGSGGDYSRAVMYEAIDRAAAGQTNDANTLDRMLQRAGFSSYQDYLDADTGGFQQNVLGDLNYFEPGIAYTGSERSVPPASEQQLTFGGLSATTQAPAPAQQPEPEGITTLLPQAPTEDYVYDTSRFQQTEYGEPISRGPMSFPYTPATHTFATYGDAQSLIQDDRKTGYERLMEKGIVDSNGRLLTENLDRDALFEISTGGLGLGENDVHNSLIQQASAAFAGDEINYAAPASVAPAQQAPAQQAPAPAQEQQLTFGHASAPAVPQPSFAEQKAAEQRAAQEAAQRAAEQRAAQEAAQRAAEQRAAQEQQLTFGHGSAPAPKQAPAQEQQLTFGGYAEGGIVSASDQRTKVKGDGIESFLMKYQSPEAVAQERRAATLRKNLAALQPQPTAPGPRPTMQQGIMPMARGPR